MRSVSSTPSGPPPACPSRPPAGPWVEQWLSPARFAGYLTATRPTGAAHWLDDPRGPVRAPLMRTKRPPDGTRVRTDVNRKPCELVEQARRRCGAKAPIGKVIAELQLGFWRYLTSAAHEKTLWVPHLYTAFPTGTRRTAVDRTIGALHLLRNRVAHHEPLLSLPVAVLSADLVHLCVMLVPELGQHLQAVTQVPVLLAARPQPAGGSSRLTNPRQPLAPHPTVMSPDL
jgi:hypothetical protein